MCYWAIAILVGVAFTARGTRLEAAGHPAPVLTYPSGERQLISAPLVIDDELWLGTAVGRIVPARSWVLGHAPPSTVSWPPVLGAATFQLADGLGVVGEGGADQGRKVRLGLLDRLPVLLRHSWLGRCWDPVTLGLLPERLLVTDPEPLVGIPVELRARIGSARSGDRAPPGDRRRHGEGGQADAYRPSLLAHGAHAIEEGQSAEYERPFRIFQHRSEQGVVMELAQVSRSCAVTRRPFTRAAFS